MAYFIQSHRNNSAGYLIEMPAQQLPQRLRQFPDLHYGRVSAKVAHDWVRSGATHGTLLYVQDGKIRRCKEG